MIFKRKFHLFSAHFYSSDLPVCDDRPASMDTESINRGLHFFLGFCVPFVIQKFRILLSNICTNMKKQTMKKACKFSLRIHLLLKPGNNKYSLVSFGTLTQVSVINNYVPIEDGAVFKGF